MTNIHFHKNNLIVDDCGYVWKIVEILGQCYHLEADDGAESLPTIEWVDKTFRPWTIKDAKDGDVLQLGFVTAIFKKYIDNDNCQCHCSIFDGEFEIPSQDGPDNSYGCHNATPASVEQRESLFEAIDKAGYIFDFEKKELKKK